MLEIDLLLLEDAMMRRNFETDSRAKALQTLCMLFVLTGLLGIFTHAVTQRDVASIAFLPSTTVPPAP